MTAPSQSDRLNWILAVIFAFACGYMHVRLQDSSLSVLMVTGFAMFLAYRRPERLWRWALLVGLSLPAAGLLAYLGHEKPSRGMIIGAFAGLAFSTVAAFGGALLRRAVGILFPPSDHADPLNHPRP